MRYDERPNHIAQEKQSLSENETASDDSGIRTVPHFSVHLDVENTENIPVTPRTDSQAVIGMDLIEEDAAKEAIVHDEQEIAWCVPDFIQWHNAPFEDLGHTPNSRVLSPEWILNITRLAVIQQQNTVVFLPDIILAELVWGKRTNQNAWPPNWRHTIGKAIQAADPLVYSIRVNTGPVISQPPLELDISAAWRKGEATCVPRCPLHGQSDNVPHRHFRVLLSDEQLGRMGCFYRCSQKERLSSWRESRFSEPTLEIKNPRLTREQAKAKHTEFKSCVADLKGQLAHVSSASEEEELQGRLWQAEYQLRNARTGQHTHPDMMALYLPPLIFGPSELVGLNTRQARLLSTLVGETTRVFGKSDRVDKAAIIQINENGSVAPFAICPGLPVGEYVSFNGNGSGKKIGLRGHGYSTTTWLYKTRYHQDGMNTEESALVSLYKDLEAIADQFGLIFFVGLTGKGPWLDRASIPQLLKSKSGLKSLAKGILRVYTKADFLDRWRRHFAECLGVRTIPIDRGEAEAHVADPRGGIHSALGLNYWMKAQGHTDVSLAKASGLNRVTINHYRTGRRKWSLQFEQKLAESLASS